MNVSIIYHKYISIKNKFKKINEPAISQSEDVWVDGSHKDKGL